MTIQTVIDVIATQLAKQRGRSILQYHDQDGEPGIKCQYRGEDGKMCAVGCIIPDELYTPKLEQLGTVYSVLRQTDDPNWSIEVRDHIYSQMSELSHDTAYEILHAFQNWHDAVTFCGVAHSGVNLNYTDLLKLHPNASDDELKGLFVESLTTIAQWWINTASESISLEGTASVS